MKRLENKVAVITGGNSGIGEATAKLFAEEGAKVVITARREDELKRVASDIQAAGGTALYIPGDATVTADVQNVIEKTIEAFGKIDILVNNAGQADYHTPTVKLTDEFWNGIIDIDLTAVMKYCRAVLPHMLRANSGAIINIGSIGGVYGCAGAAYSSAKAGLIGLTMNLAIQYYGSGIRINAVHPGSTLTPLFDPDKFALADTEMIELTKRVHVNERSDMIMPRQQATAVLFFASDDSSAVNGQNLVVDYGGRL